VQRELEFKLSAGKPVPFFLRVGIVMGFYYYGIVNSCHALSPAKL
jgi:hypothetical protein